MSTCLHESQKSPGIKSFHSGKELPGRDSSQARLEGTCSVPWSCTEFYIPPQRIIYNGYQVEMALLEILEDLLRPLH